MLNFIKVLLFLLKYKLVFTNLRFSNYMLYKFTGVFIKKAVSNLMFNLKKFIVRVSKFIQWFLSYFIIISLK